MLLVAAMAGLATWPRHTIAIGFGLYALTGPGLIVVGWLRTWLVTRVEAS